VKIIQKRNQQEPSLNSAEMKYSNGNDDNFVNGVSIEVFQSNEKQVSAKKHYFKGNITD
jgi:hypothetical protein